MNSFPPVRILNAAFLALCLTFTVPASVLARVIIHEIAWMGTAQSPSEQWVELYNSGEEYVDLDGWNLGTESGSVAGDLSGRLAPGQTLLLAASDAEHLAGIPVHHTFNGTLSADGEVLSLHDTGGRLVDRVSDWHAGCADTYATMQRLHPYTEGDRTDSWKTSTVRYDYGYGTPGFRNPPDSDNQYLYHVYHDENTINVFFNQKALTELALENNEANHRINLEERIIDRIRQARHRIDIALYEINLPDIVDALIERAAEGVEVRLLIDAKSPSGGDRNVRYRLMRVYLEQLLRGQDGQLGSRDSISVFANSPIFAVDDPDYREQYGLPRDPADDIPYKTLSIGRGEQSGFLIVQGAKSGDDTYYSPSGQMHNKFVLIDDYRLLTGSMNFTETGIYGTYRDRRNRRPNGNSNNLIDLHSPEVVRIYRDEFNQMWGCTTSSPCPVEARFRSEKKRGRAQHEVQLGDKDLQILFSPGYNVVEHITDFVDREAHESLYFCIFAWSDSNLENTIKQKWEGNPLDSEGSPTGFRLKGVFERIFWNQWWSANINMEGRDAPRESANNPNIRWRNPPPIFRDREVRKLHHKYMLIDADTSHNPTVITGSANWSRNANEINDENTLFIHDQRIANQFLQEFYARYQQAGGEIYDGPFTERYVTAEQ